MHATNRSGAPEKSERIHARRIDEFLDGWYLRRQGCDRPDLFRPRSAKMEAALDPSSRHRYRELIGGFVDRFRPDRRDFRTRVQRRCQAGNEVPDDEMMAHALSEMGVEALKRHLGVAMPDDHPGQRSLIETYEMDFMPKAPANLKD